MKRVSFKVAKAIKEAGYPQYPLIPAYQDDIIKEYIEKREDICDDVPTYACPTYLEVWLWLWREKKIIADIGSNERGILASIWTSEMDKIWDDMSINYTDPEEAIIAAIEYLLNKDLIK